MATTDLYSQLLNPVTPEIMGLERQRQYARMLMQQSAQPQGQMVSGRYVAPAFTQQLQAALNPIIGAYLSKSADDEALKLAEKLRNKEAQDVNKFFEYQYGRPAQQLEMAGPYGQGVGEAGANVPMPTLDIPAVQRNPQMAYQIAATSQSPILRQQLAEMLKGQKLGEGETITRYNPLKGEMETVAAGTPKVRAPIQIDTGTTIELRDPLDPTKVLQVVPKSQMPTAGQIVERDEGTFLVDTRTGQAKPVLGPQGQPLLGSGKPLTEGQGKAVGFGARAMVANEIATDLENKGVTNIGATRTVIGGIAGTAPLIGEKLEQGVKSAFNVVPQIVGGPSPEQQQNDQARRNFISAVLRKESGAVIGPVEYANEERKYFPQLGDSEDVIKQKQDARRLAIEALKAEAGPQGQKQMQNIVSQQKESNQTPIFAVNPQTNERIQSTDGGKTWKPAPKAK
jgi:hypothetical protein